MKKHDFLILGASLLYSFLFYGQHAGLNFFLFSMALSTVLLLFYRERARDPKWILAFIGTVCSGFSVFLLGNSLSVTANILSLALLSAFTFEPRTSVITAWCYSVFTLITAVGFMILALINRSRDSEEAQTEGQGTRLSVLAVIIPLVMVTLFFILYRQGNVLFYEFTKNINFDFISFSWICFSMGGFILMYSFFCYRSIPELILPESRLPNKLGLEPGTGIALHSKPAFSQEHLSGLIALGALNVLTFILNILDVKFLFFDGKLPSGVTYSAFVHQGVELLIFSIITALAVILYYFRGDLNFSGRKKVLAALAFIWIGQNMLMVFTGCFKNGIYIHEYSLTYKRIGVYFWLVLALFGLITTGVKIYRLYTHVFLLRINSWLCYVTIVLAAFINWDRMIAEYNIRYSKTVDYAYLLELSWNTLPAVTDSYLKPGFVFKNEGGPIGGDELFYSERKSYTVNELLRNKLSDFIYEERASGWQSCCLSKRSVNRLILEKMHPVSVHAGKGRVLAEKADVTPTSRILNVAQP